ncbi:protein NRT1/ PTR FAMILY 1.2-like [Impatiens glandulifera]|uniref:protein NRT1/ PTR FAMILY 1.2-like n=1 Tax=Impatiens glandulifera TaxID=253017 RepID=UPI001FB17A08|nr:protein NRT1/ PTR FAMILY 1.2-like [Impatiens glandulifera]
MIPQARPTPCVDSSNDNLCISPTIFQLMFLCSSFLLMSIGAGGIRSASMAFGADQLQDDAQSLNRTGAMETYINWYSATSALSVVIAMTFIVYIQDNLGWKIGFGVPLVLMFLSALSFFLASSLYVKSKPNSSLITGLIQVIVASFKKRNLSLPSNENDLLYHHDMNSVLTFPSEKIRFLNKSCMIEDPNEDLSPNGSASNPWTLCTVDQVEALKKLIMLIPLWSTGILMSVNISQPSFPVLQAGSMDRHITQNFQIPAATFSMFTIISLVAWVLLYDRILIPVASYILGRPARLSPITRMGLGIFMSFLSVVVAAYVESVRRSVAIKEGLVDNPKGMVPMSAFWLLPQHMLMGVAEALNMVAQIELYMCELPRGMTSIAANLSTISMGLGGILASFIMNTIDGITKGGGNESWHFEVPYGVIMSFFPSGKTEATNTFSMSYDSTNLTNVNTDDSVRDEQLNATHISERNNEYINGSSDAVSPAFPSIVSPEALPPNSNANLDSSSLNSDSYSSIENAPSPMSQSFEKKMSDVVSIAEMRALLFESRSSLFSTKPGWSSMVDNNLTEVKSQIVNSQNLESNSELYAPLFRNEL